MIPPTTVDFARAEARKKWRYASPYRVGIVVGQHGLTVANPYEAASRAAKCFDEGVAWGWKLGEKAGGS